MILSPNNSDTAVIASPVEFTGISRDVVLKTFFESFKLQRNPVACNGFGLLVLLDFPFPPLFPHTKAMFSSSYVFTTYLQNDLWSGGLLLDRTSVCMSIVYHITLRHHLCIFFLLLFILL
jgi:hypothetical protein